MSENEEMKNKSAEVEAHSDSIAAAAPAVTAGQFKWNDLSATCPQIPETFWGTFHVALRIPRTFFWSDLLHWLLVSRHYS